MTFQSRMDIAISSRVRVLTWGAGCLDINFQSLWDSAQGSATWVPEVWLTQVWSPVLPLTGHGENYLIFLHFHICKIILTGVWMASYNWGVTRIWPSCWSLRRYLLWWVHYPSGAVSLTTSQSWSNSGRVSHKHRLYCVQSPCWEYIKYCWAIAGLEDEGSRKPRITGSQEAGKGKEIEFL